MKAIFLTLEIIGLFASIFGIIFIQKDLPKERQFINESSYYWLGLITISAMLVITCFYQF